MLQCLSENPLKEEYLPPPPPPVESGPDWTLILNKSGEEYWDLPSSLSDESLSEWSEDQKSDKILDNDEPPLQEISSPYESLIEEARLSEEFLKWSENQYWKIRIPSQINSSFDIKNPCSLRIRTLNNIRSCNIFFRKCES